MPEFLNEIKKVGAPFYVGEGTNTRSWVHTEDLMTVYPKLLYLGVGVQIEARRYMPFNRTCTIV